MKLADKPCYPSRSKTEGDRNEEKDFYHFGADGLNLRERLIIALASNPAVIRFNTGDYPDEIIDSNVRRLRKQADAIIEQLEGDK